MTCTAALIAILFPAASAGAADAPAFAKRPAAVREGGAVRIRFAADRATDVTVAVLDAKGNVVRHLAAGMLGPNAPAPLKAGSLAQDLVWDGTNDRGEDAAGGPFTIRVGLGTRAEFGKVLFYEPGIAFAPRAVTVGPDGLLYVLQEHGQTKSTFLLQAFTKEGRYVKTIVPYPANLPAERLTGLQRVRLPDGRWIPAIGMANFRDLYPESTGMRPQTMPITSKGRIVLVSASKTHNAGLRPQHLLYVDTDGGVSAKDYIGPLTSAEKMPHGMCFVALSPDERWIYASGQRKGNANDDRFLGTQPAHNVVYRIGWDDTDLAKPFIGEYMTAGADETHLDYPRGLATDAQGRLYVCDRGNNRVAVFDAEGKWIGKVDAAAPEQVAVDSKTGALYVLTFAPGGRGQTACKLVKFPGIGKPAAYAMDLGPSYPAIDLDSAGERPVIWLARTFWESWENPQRRRGVEKVVDLGDGFDEPVEVVKHRALPDVFHVAASMVTDDVFVHSYSESRFARIDGITGEVAPLDLRGQDVACGPDGHVYVARVTKWSPGLKTIERYDRDGRPLKFAALDSHAIPDVPGNIGGHAWTAAKGFSLSPRGDIVVLDVDQQKGVSVYGPDGALKARKVIDGLSKAGGSPCMDRDGNLFIACAAKPADELYPKALHEAKAPGPYYAWMYGSVIKFPPAGGRLYYPPPRYQPKPDWLVWPVPEPEKKLRLVKAGINEMYVDGAVWLRPGFSALAGGQNCGCYTGRFCLDWYGRAFIPDVGMFSVFVVDGNNNEIIRFGDYGNEDSAGPGSAVPTPAIPLSWPHAVSVGRSGVYVSDFINRRIVRVDLKAAAEATCAIE